VTLSHSTVAHSEPKSVEVNGINIVYDTFGDPAAIPFLLIMGLGGQLVSWDEDFCFQLAAEGYWVIRFDNRDVGLSTKFYEIGTPNILEFMSAVMMGQEVKAPYLLTDMAADAVGLLDALDIASAHVLGVSMGGMIAQTMAIHYPDRVRTLTSIMSSTGDVSLPQPGPQALSLLTEPAPREREAYLDYSVRTWRILGSPGFRFDEDRVRRRAGLSFDRGLNPPGFARQLAAILASGSRREALRDVKIPTLVIHGTADPLVPVAGGIDTAESIPGARLMLIDGMGHDLPVDLWPRLLEAITQHAA
jgi:pimeloyl-ACP methyl ester carboxylesterase